MDDQKIERARELMAAGRYDAAKRILIDLPDNPMAIGLLSTIEQIAPATSSKQKNEDIYRQDEAMQYQPPKDKVRVGQSDRPEPRNYILMAFITLGGYFFMWPVGVFLNLHFIGEARKDKEVWGDDAVEGVGCLWALLMAQMVGLIAFFVFLYIVYRAITTGFW